MPTQKYRIKGLRSEDETVIARGARELKGVLFAVASHGAQCAEVEFEDDLVTPEEIAEALRSLGYEVELAG